MANKCLKVGEDVHHRLNLYKTHGKFRTMSDALNDLLRDKGVV